MAIFSDYTKKEFTPSFTYVKETVAKSSLTTLPLLHPSIPAQIPKHNFCLQIDPARCYVPFIAKPTLKSLVVLALFKECVLAQKKCTPEALKEEIFFHKEYSIGMLSFPIELKETLLKVNQLYFGLDFECYPENKDPTLVNLFASFPISTKSFNGRSLPYIEDSYVVGFRKCANVVIFKEINETPALILSQCATVKALARFIFTTES